MQLHLEQPDHAFFLRGADGSHALVNDRRLDRSFILAPDRLIEDWDVATIAALDIAHIEPLIALQPELILLGCGDTQAFPPAQTLAHCLQRGIGIESMTNAAAARTFNVLASEDRKVVAGFVIAA